MKPSVRLAALGVALAAAGALLAAPADAATARHGSGGAPQHAVFVQTDNPKGNAIVVYRSRPNGTLVKAGTYRTGGRGGALDGSVVDHLASQGSLTLDSAHHLLYATNAGSNTITVFSVSGARLTRRQTISSGGTFPVSVTTHGDLVYVLNARDGGVLQGYLRTGEHLKRIAVWRRTLGLNPAATPEFVSTPGQVTFNPAGTALVVTTKANGNMLQVFRVDGTRGLSGAATVTTDTGNVPFAGVFDAHGRLVLAEAGDNAVATYDLARNGAASLVARAATGQQATCWIVRAGSHVYLSNAASGTLSAYAVSPTGKLTAKGTTATDAGTVDAAVSPGGHFLYVQTGAKGIVDEFRIGARGHLARIGAVTVPGAVGGEGIVAS